MTTAISNLESGSSVRSKLNDIWAKLELNEIDTSIADTAVDVFVYDTSKDSDGGAWRKRCQHTSWYNETLNTSTRGSRREFPAVAVIVTEADTVTIYDGDDPSLPMWMVFNVGLRYSIHNSAPITSISMLNGELRVGAAGSGGGSLAEISFLADKSGLRINSTVYYYTRPALSQRNTSVTTDGTISAGLVNREVNDVAMTVLPDAPIDPATGLPVPTIAVATDGGVSVIKDDGTVVDSADTYAVNSVNFDANNFLWYPRLAGSTQRYSQTYAADGFQGRNWQVDFPNAFAAVSTATVASNTESEVVLGTTNTNQGISRLSVNPSAESNSMVAYTTSTYNTGGMNGDIKGAFLSDTDDTDLVGGTDADRSVNGNDLTVNGTITRTPVATGADLVAYSGFSASNYLEQPYNSDLDFGTGDFCVMGWVTYSGGTNFVIDRQDGASANTDRLNFYLTASAIGCRCDATSVSVATTFTVGVRYFVAVARKSGVAYFYVNGGLVGSAAQAGDVADASASYQLTVAANGETKLESPTNAALLRISATAPTAEQIAKIYNDEKVLFQENAACTLYGASDAVTALAFDDSTQMLNVGTSAGRSVFQGLRRVDNTTSAVTTAISAQNGLVIEQ